MLTTERNFMRRLLSTFVILFLCSCDKDEIPVSMDFSLLSQFNWQAIDYHEEKSLLDTSQIISYSDTILYSFDGDEFTVKNQYTVMGVIFGSEKPVNGLENISTTSKGQYEINTRDSSITLTYKSTVGGNPAWGIPGTDTTIQVKWRVLTLNRETLKIQSEPSKTNSIPSLNRIQTYSSVIK